ncbi:hypothetical protein JN06_00343 [Bacteroides zoogleoformans]|nr:hypothetical protein JN06_00343 [Bacteroides zoogleoformans]
MKNLILTTLLSMTMMSNAQINDKQTAMQEPAKLLLTQQWDKTFLKSDKVEHKKVTFHNHFGIELAADMYTPKEVAGKLSAIAVSGPFGAVKEQSSGIYAQRLAEMGFLTIAFDPSFTGESGGQPRDMFSLDINTEDFQAAVDYLSNLPNVDANHIGILGICGWGGIALNAAANDPRIKATVASTMYDMPRIGAWGYNDSGTADERYQSKAQIAQLRTEEYATGAQQRAATNVPFDKLTGKEPAFIQQYSAYYTTKRGYNERSVNSKNGWKLQAMTGWMNNTILAHPEDLRNAVLIVHGEKAHSRYMGEDTFKKLKGDNKQLIIVPDATHTDLYDGGDNNYIPFDQIKAFYQNYLK